MAFPNANFTGWNFHNIPTHRELQMDEIDIAARLFELLCEEIKSFTEGKIHIGLLLSGGMDSRIVAGILDFLIKKGIINVQSVTGYTWGNHCSRDVIYAKQIAKTLGWNWKHFLVTPNDMWNNLILAGHRGCEYSGIHLHAIPQIAEIASSEIDILLAGSYGDSVGRAEYSGRHMSRLLPLTNRIRNFGFLFNPQCFKAYKGLWQQDIHQYHRLFPRPSLQSQLELDYELHYMRRMLNPCMELINENTPVRQAFTSPKVFGFMWSLSPHLRNDNIYTHLLNHFATDLSEFNWARTGLPYGSEDGKPDQYTKNHHDYKTIIQKDLFPQIVDRLKQLPEIGKDIFDEGAVRQLVSGIRRLPNQNNDYLERLTWLVSFSFFSEKYMDLIDTSTIASKQFSSSGIKTAIEYTLINLYRKLRLK